VTSAPPVVYCMQCHQASKADTLRGLLSCESYQTLRRRHFQSVRITSSSFWQARFQQSRKASRNTKEGAQFQTTHAQKHTTYCLGSATSLAHLFVSSRCSMLASPRRQQVRCSRATQQILCKLFDSRLLSVAHVSAYRSIADYRTAQ
jgi:hypothetical protein